VNRSRAHRAARRARPRGARTRARGVSGARLSLRFFRQATILAVAVTAFILLLLEPGQERGAAGAQPAGQVTDVPDTVSIIQDVPTEDLQRQVAEPEGEVRADTLIWAAREEAIRTVRSLWYGFLSNLPKFFVAFVVLLFAGLAVRVVRPLMRRALRSWAKANAATALAGIAIWLLAFGIAISVIAGDIRAMVGSVGLIGLALSWALQTPIESFTGWLMNSFQGYYRVGDRVSVGEVFGDVYQIDFLTTTVWEIGSPHREGFVAAEQPTGRLITFPNSEVLAGSIVNLTRDFPYVWDELAVPVGNRSDLGYAMELLRRIAAEHVGPQMEGPAAAYGAILRTAGLEAEVAKEPQVFVSLADSWTTLSIRYLVAARERRKWNSELTAAIAEALSRPEHGERIIAVFPRQQVQLIGPDGRPREIGSTSAAGGPGAFDRRGRD
jgi:small-conductance mechanosensitive channel